MDALLEPTDAHAAPLTVTYVSPGALDVRQTVGPLLRGATEPTMRFTPNGFWRVVRTPEGPATLRVQWRAVDDAAGAVPALAAMRVDAHAWGSGAAWVLRGLPDLLGDADYRDADNEGAGNEAAENGGADHGGADHGDAENGDADHGGGGDGADVTAASPGDGGGRAARDPWAELDLSRVPLLDETRRRHPGMRLTRTSLVFESLVPSILEQKVTTVEARRSWHRLLRAYGEVPPGPAPEGMRVQPTARQWQLIPSWEWHRAGVGPDRSRTIVAAAAVAASLDRLAARAGSPGTAGVLEKLQSLHGVGRWTAAETSQRSHGHPDAVSVGDYHLAAHVGWVLIGRPVDDDGMLELLEPWRGQRQRIVRLILASGIPKPRFGSRATITDHRWH